MKQETEAPPDISAHREVVEYVDPRTKDPAAGAAEHDASVAQVHVTCFRVTASDGWEPTLHWEHDDHRWCEPREA